MTDDKLKAAHCLPDERFFNSPEGRILRILSEYAEPLSRFRRSRFRTRWLFRFGAISERAAAASKLEAMKGWRRKALSQRWRCHATTGARKLAFLLTQWSITIPARRGVLSSRPEAARHHGSANLGAKEAGGKTIGLNIISRSSSSQPHITPSLNFEFHYFFMRKSGSPTSPGAGDFPGRVRTWTSCLKSDPAQTEKLAKDLVVIYGSEYWKKRSTSGHD